MIQRWALGAMILGFSVVSIEAETAFITASKTTCEDVVRSVKGRISYSQDVKSGELGFHHCVHRRLASPDFPQRNPDNPNCRQVDMAPEVVGIFPPLPHDENETLPMFGRPNPYFIADGSSCEVKYAQYYFRP